MRKKIVLSVLTTATVALTLFVMVSPDFVSAKVLYSAGNLTPGTTICNCPVPIGDCVCATTVPDPPPQQGENPMETEKGGGSN